MITLHKVGNELWVVRSNEDAEFYQHEPLRVPKDLKHTLKILLKARD